jgi:RecA-family ATPase
MPRSCRRSSTFLSDSVDRAVEAAASCGGRIVDPRPHKDANELLLIEGALALWDKVMAAEAVEAAPEVPINPTFVNIADLAGQPVPEREWHVADLVPAKTVTTISGDGGVGKSLLALQLATSTALGIPWAGRPVDAAPVLFITAEDDLDEVRRRVADICALIDRDQGELNLLEVLSLAGWDAICAAWDRRTNTLVPTALYAEIDAKVRDTAAKLAIFDTLADLHSGQENDRAHARQVISQIRGLALRNDCAVVLLAHPSLTGLATDTGASGSTAWNNSVRSRLYLERIFMDGNEADPDLRKLTTMKANDGPVGAEVLFRWTDGALKLESAGTGLDRMAAEAKAERIFMDLLREREAQGRPVSHSPSSTYAPTQFASDPQAEGVSRAQFRAAMERLFAAKKIIIDTAGPPSRQRSRIVSVDENSWSE